jgi:hypothetical protein
MRELRRWALWVAFAAILMTVLVCIGSGFVITPDPIDQRIGQLQADPGGAPEGVSIEDLEDLEPGDFGEEAQDPPGLGIPYLALTNGLLLVILTLMVLPLVIGARWTPLVGGIVSLIGGFVAVIAGIIMAIVAFVALMIMVSLFLAVPFGTLAYLAIFGFFDIWGAGTALALIMFFQLAAIVFLIVAQQSMLGNKRLVFFLLLAVLLTLLMMILHAIVPIILVSITDALGALIIAIVGVIWGLLMLIGGIISLVKQLQLGKQGGGPLREREASEVASPSAPTTAPGTPA